MDKPGSSVHGISHGRILEWVAHLLLQGIFPTQDQTHVSCVDNYILYPWGPWKAWVGLHTTGWGDMLNRVTQQKEWDHPTTTCLGQSSFTPQLPLMGLDTWWREERVLRPREKVGSSLATVTLGIQPRAKNKGPALYHTAQFRQTSVPGTLSSQLFVYSYIPIFCLYLCCNFCHISKLTVTLCIWYFFLNYHLLCIVGMKILHRFQRKDSI